MDSPHSPPPRTPPELKSRPGQPQSGEGANSLPDSTGGGGRLMPRPPGLLPRLLMLCLRPETWAEVARYPSRFTFVPLLVAILIAALAVGIGESVRTLNNLTQFAATYDARGYPALQLSSDGILSANGPVAAPIRFDNGPTSFMVLVDPSGKTIPGSIKSGQTILVTDKEIWVFAQPDSPLFHSTLADMNSILPPKGTTALINGTTLRQYLNDHGSGMAAVMSSVTAGILFVSNSLWSALMVFLVAPFVIMAAAMQGAKKEGEKRPVGRLILPRRASYRMAAAVLVPLVMVDGFLHAVGHPVNSLLGPEWTSLFWFVAAAGLAVWAGIIARVMYTPKVMRAEK